MTDLVNDEDQENLDAKKTLWNRIPKYKWWVTPLNIILISLFLIIVDIVTKPNTAFINIDWAWWPIGGLLLLYLISFIISKRPTLAWIVGPILMIITSILLLVIDLINPPNDGLLRLDWATIPIAALLIFGILIPIITKFGRKKEKPIDRFRKALADMEKQDLD
ncbi:MAG: hypothetical protein FK730_16550 [Asgard group archaeon]|nr:hypothetical protein [Asgard group archaeon]